MFMSHQKNAGEAHDTHTADKYFENVPKFKYLEMRVRN